MKNIILSWIQGSGKGTQAKKILEHFEGKLWYLEMGQILRSLLRTENGIGIEIEQTMNKGGLVAPWITVWLFKVFLAAIWDNKNFLADGFPREPIQYDAFHETMETENRDYIVIELVVDEDKCIQRIQNRKTCADCGEIHNDLLEKHDVCKLCGSELQVREDDKDLEVIKTRMGIFKNSTKKVIDDAGRKGKLVQVNGDQDIDKVFEDILKIIG